MRQYSGIANNATLGAEGAGVKAFILCQCLVISNASGLCFPAGAVVASSDPTDPLLQKRVFLTPMRGWESNPDAPEAKYEARQALHVEIINLLV